MLRTTNTTLIWKRVLIMSVMVLLGVATAALELTTESFAAEPPRVTFASPAEVGAALAKAAKASDENSLADILGVDVKALLFTGNDEEDEAALQAFAAKYETMDRWVDMGDGSRVLYIGADNFAFPVPLAQNSSGRWYFDGIAGGEEVRARNIGRNELLAIDACNAVNACYGDLPLVAFVLAVNGQRSLAQQAGGTSRTGNRIPPAPDARASTVTHPAAIRGSWGSIN